MNLFVCNKPVVNYSSCVFWI